MKRITIILFACFSMLILVSCGIKPIPLEHQLVKMEKEKISLDDLGNGTTLIYNDPNFYLHPSNLTSKVDIQLDGKNVGQLQAKDFVIVQLENGDHNVTLKHWDLVNMRSKHFIAVTDTVKVIRIKPTITSNQLDIVNQLPEDWDQYVYMDPEAALEQARLEKNLHIVINGGMGYRIGRVAKDVAPFMKDYIQSTKLGSSVGLDVSYFLVKGWGLGLKYNRFDANGVLNNIMVTNFDGSTISGSLTEDISTDLIGLSLLKKFSFSNPDHFIMSGVSHGYMRYNNNVVLANRNYRLKGATYGAAIDLGYNYSISRNFSLGAQAAIIGAVLKNMDQVEGGRTTTSEVNENLSRIDFTAGLRYRI